MPTRVISLKRTILHLKQRTPMGHKTKHDHYDSMLIWLNSKNDHDYLKDIELKGFHNNLLLNEKSINKYEVIDIKDVFERSNRMDTFLDQATINNTSPNIVAGVILLLLSNNPNQGRIAHPLVLHSSSKDDKMVFMGHCTTTNNNIEQITSGIRIGENINMSNIRFIQDPKLIKIFTDNKRGSNTWAQGEFGDKPLINVGLNSNNNTQFIAEPSLICEVNQLSNNLKSSVIPMDYGLVKDITTIYDNRTDINAFYNNNSCFFNISKQELDPINFISANNNLLWHKCMSFHNNDARKALVTFNKQLRLNENMQKNNIQQNLKYELMSEEVRECIFSGREQIGFKELPLYKNSELYDNGIYKGDQHLTELPAHLKNILIE